MSAHIFNSFSVISAPLAWFLMESPTLWLTLLLFPQGRHASDPKAETLMTPFLLHYFHRTALYPFRLTPFPLALMAFTFNSYLQARTVSHYIDYSTGLFWHRFFLGMWINVWANGLHDWSWVRLGFCVYTFANLGPKARHSIKFTTFLSKLATLCDTSAQDLTFKYQLLPSRLPSPTSSSTVPFWNPPPRHCRSITPALPLRLHLPFSMPTSIHSKFTNSCIRSVG
uniref:Steroid reductase DET2 n=1 Tax=Cajanus cajan TaxID=3821 RepID=A0A151SQI4_CAJCA|nr:putative steroid reductase DET2 [Cajanus cajan]